MDAFESARNIAHVLFAKYKRSEITSEIIRNEVKNVFLMQGFADVNSDELIAQLEADFEIYTGKATELSEIDVKPWLGDLKAGINWELWDRYRVWMKTQNGSFPIESLDDATDKILDKCVNPKTNGSWDRRGMVVGNVQSGKTANYSGLINKATDAGYKLIIVIAGVHNSLRSQTQVRIDDSYIGRNSADFIQRKQNIKTGVGFYPCETEIYSYTSSGEKGDFNRIVASQINVPIGGKSPTILVIKKNTSILENLIFWLNQFASNDSKGNRKIMNVPLLVIDDEADNASVNSGSDVDVRSINRLIRTMLNLFSQNTFIGYTATPYANLFIPSEWNQELETTVKDVTLKIGEDLFPRDFIVNIPAPSNYIGAAKVFGFLNDQTGEETEGMDIIRLAEDQEPTIPRRINRENVTQLPDDTPQSLKSALKSFILVCAIRRLRGHDKKHNSMLVHAVSRVAWIDRLAWLVNEIMRAYKLQIKSGQGPLINELETLFETDFKPTTLSVNKLEVLGYNDPKIKNHNWEDVKAQLLEAATKIEVRAVHGTKNTRSLEYHTIEEINYNDYENGLSVIAVGGNKLARGITLEGLSVSYYLRTTRMYDSLMQMGRWFGYRPGYADLCRLYTTEQLVGWYRHVTMATEEMRADFDELAATPNMRPIHFQLKVRTHPGMLMITSVSKMRGHERIQIGFSGKFLQTYAFDKNPSVIESNYLSFKHLISRLSSPKTLQTTKGTNGLLWSGIKGSIVSDFIVAYKTNYLRSEVIQSYIERQNKNGKLDNWSVAIILNSGDTITTQGSLRDEEVLSHLFEWKDGKIIAGLPARNFATDSIKELKVQGNKNAILDKRARMIDLDLPSSTTEGEIKETRNNLEQPLLVIMPLDPRVSDDLNPSIPLIGFGVVFPKFDGEETYEYAARPMQEEFEEEPQEDDDKDNEE
jgi:hypothetical protein